MKENTEVEEFEQINVDKPAVADPVLLPAVGPNESGLGHPYAPQNWPNPGDNWRWKVGSRVSKLGHHADRYLYAPKRLPQPRAFASKKSLERYIRKEFPDTDICGFFAMFSWNIPAKEPVSSTSDPKASSSFNSPRDVKGNSLSRSQSTECPAGRKSCKGLFLEAEKPTMPCDICCAQHDFCRHCSCILCSKTVKSSFGYSYFRCEKVVNEAYICGHVAHLNCALRCNLAGTLGGVFKLDAAYYCRRCDARSDLIPHAANLLEMCKSINSSNDLEKILKLGIGILGGSEREPAKVLLRSLENAFDKPKLTNGSPLISVWEAGENVSTVPSSLLSNAVDVNAQTTNRDSLGTIGQNTAATNSPDAQEIDPQKIEDEIYNTLQSLKKSQEAEYQQAREKLNTQKTYLINLQEQLQHEKAQLDDLSSSRDRNASLDIVVSRTEQIRRELKKLKEMQDTYKKFRNIS